MIRVMIGVMAVYFTTITVYAQPNLVPNGSFEEFTDCPNSGAQIWKAEPWNSVEGSVDYYHACGINGWGTPNNWAGYQEAMTGQAYIGIAVCFSPRAITNPFMSNVREFAGVGLNQSLVGGVEYQVEFYVNLLDVAWYATKNIGAYVSFGQPSNAIEYLFSLQPQIKYEGLNFLSSKEGWTQIVGTFIAQGGENYITIGNFNNDETTDTLQVAWEGPEQGYSAYYIDDVSVTPVDSLVGMDDFEVPTMSIYPNPATENFIIENARSGETLALYDIAGKRVFSMVLHSSKQTISLGDIPAGVYMAALEKDGAIVERRKLIIQ